MSTTLHGIPVSPEIGVGPVVVAGTAPRPPFLVVPEERSSSYGRIALALHDVAAALDNKVARAEGPTAQIITATAMIARDHTLLDAIGERLTTGADPMTAVWDAIGKIGETFTAAGEYMADRVTDLFDIRDRVLCRLAGVPEPGVPQLTTEFILVAEDLAPSMVVDLDPAYIKGLVLAAGGPTAHTAIIARSLSIPAVVRCLEALSLQAGTVVAVDGHRGTVHVDPSTEHLDRIKKRGSERAALLAAAVGPGGTRDGHRIPLYANIGSLDDARAAKRADAEGVGLFRTEFLFLDRATAPTRDEQTGTYTAIFAELGELPVTVRTLDAGSDKPVPYATTRSEENPALGVRGFRLDRTRPDLLDDQLHALAVASDATAAKVKVMAPMVTTVDETITFAARARSVALPSVGVMIEVPAAALCAPEFLAHVDFVSIGTNDLAQYTVAADRGMGELAYLLDPWQPGVLRLIEQVAAAGIAEGKPVSVCGESAADPLMALFLIGVGITSLSMSPGSIPAVRYALSRHSLHDCRRIAHAALTTPRATEARTAALAAASPELAAFLTI